MGKIRTIRRRLGLTQEGFAKLIGVHQITVSHWETGARKPSAMAVKAIRAIIASRKTIRTRL